MAAMRPARRPDNRAVQATSGRRERHVYVTFGVHVSAESAASWMTAIASCGVLRAADASERSYVVTVRRAGAMEYLETLLRQGQERGVLSWAPDP
jgi:hypothetical protein